MLTVVLSALLLAATVLLGAGILLVVGAGWPWALLALPYGASATLFVAMTVNLWRQRS